MINRECSDLDSGWIGPEYLLLLRPHLLSGNSLLTKSPIVGPRYSFLEYWCDLGFFRNGYRLNDLARFLCCSFLLAGEHSCHVTEELGFLSLQFTDLLGSDLGICLAFAKSGLGDLLGELLNLLLDSKSFTIDLLLLTKSFTLILLLLLDDAFSISLLLA